MNAYALLKLTRTHMCALEASHSHAAARRFCDAAVSEARDRICDRERDKVVSRLRSRSKKVGTDVIPTLEGSNDAATYRCHCEFQDQGVEVLFVLATTVVTIALI